MTLEELGEILEQTGFPVAYSHFLKPQTPPFICYLAENSDNLIADDEVYQEFDNVRIELYTVKKDSEAERKVKQVLNANKLPYQTSETYIKSENLFLIIYEVSL